MGGCMLEPAYTQGLLAAGGICKNMGNQAGKQHDMQALLFQTYLQLSTLPGLGASCQVTLPCLAQAGSVLAQQPWLLAAKTHCVAAC